MRFDAGSGWDVSPWDVQLIGLASTLKLYKCANWAETSSHGGNISVNEVVTLFDYIPAADNQNGATDYRKCHIKNTGEPTGTIYITPVLISPDSSLDARITISIAAGTTTDTMSTKPDDSTYAEYIEAEIETNGYQPIWIKRTISSELPAYLKYIQGVQVGLTVTATV